MKHPFESLNVTTSWDLRGKPSTACVCGCVDMLAVVRFDPDTAMPAWWMTEVMCARCHCLLTAPIPELTESDTALIPEGTDDD